MTRSLHEIRLMALAGAMTAIGALPALAEEWNGAYAGAHAEAGTTVHRLEAPADTASLKGAGANSVAGGVHAGYDLRWGDAVIGTEVEANGGEKTATFASKLGGGELKREWSLGISLRGGILPSEHTLVYGRAGYTRSRFSARAYTLQGAVDEREDFDGFHLGAGMETRIAPSASLRLEYRYTRHDEKNIGTASAPLMLRPTDHSMHMGVSWRFDDPSPRRERTATEDWTGLFAGAQVAAAVHNTDLRQQGAYRLESLGGEGIDAGLFAGYDHLLNPLSVIGVEAGAIWSRVNSKAQLGPHSARVRLDRAYHASARLGWLVQPETLLYMRAGWMRGRMEGNLNGLEASVWRDGLLAGFGMETQLLQAVNLRLEYRHVRFDSDFVGGTRVSPSYDSGSVGLAMRF